MRCPIEHCTEKAPPRGVLCPIHWCLVPERIQLTVTRLFNPEASREDQSGAYFAAALEAVEVAARAAKMVSAVPRLRALTLHRPWAWLIAAGHKPLENRTWDPPDAMIGQHLAIHAGQTIDSDGAEWVRRTFGIDFPARAWDTGIVAVAVVDRVFHGGQRDSLFDVLATSPWFIGDVAWVFREVVAMPGVGVKGAQGLWTVPEDVAAQVWYRRAVGLAKGDRT